MTETDEFVSSLEHKTNRINKKGYYLKQKRCYLPTYLEDLLKVICWEWYKLFQIQMEQLQK